MKTCDSCKYKDESWGNNCSHYLVTKPDPVHGSLLVGCQEARSGNSDCGPKGKLWEPTMFWKLNSFVKGHLFANPHEI